MKQKRWMNPSIQEGVLFLILSGWLTWYSLDHFGRSLKRDWTQSPGLFPLVISVLIFFLALCILFHGLKEDAHETKAIGKTTQALVLLGISLLYYLALAVIRIPYLGITVASMTLRISTFEIATVAFLLAMMLYLGVRNKKVLVFVPICSSAFLSIMFRTLLHVLLP